MSDQTFDEVPVQKAVLRQSIQRDVRVIIPNPVIIGLAILSGAAFLYLLLLFQFVPVHAVDGHTVTIVLAVAGVCCAVYGWLRILNGERRF